MQNCFLTINKETQVASYLHHRSIINVVEEHRSLSELRLDNIAIVDVDKFLYIYYQTDDSDLSFRSDMNILRTLMSSAFFHASEVLFILVNNQNPLLEDLVYSALRDCSVTRDKIEIISHTGALMLADVGKYLSGSASGQVTASSYRDVYVTEADKEEKERFVNQSTGLDSVLPALTDMASMYEQRAHVEAISAGRVVSEQSFRPTLIKDFTRVNVESAKTKRAFVISGERWSDSHLAIQHLVSYFHVVGYRSLIINLDNKMNIAGILDESTELNLMDIKVPITPATSISILNARFNQLGYIIEYLNNVKGVDDYIIYCDDDNYKNVLTLIEQLCEVTHGIYVAHYNRDSIERFVERGLKATAMFLSFGRFKEDFVLTEFKEQLEGIIVAEFPTEDVDVTEFYDYAIGGERND